MSDDRKSACFENGLNLRKQLIFVEKQLCCHEYTDHLLYCISQIISLNEVSFCSVSLLVKMSYIITNVYRISHSRIMPTSLSWFWNNYKLRLSTFDYKIYGECGTKQRHNIKHFHMLFIIIWFKKKEEKLFSPAN